MTDGACAAIHPPRRIVLTGGPGAGKTAVLEMMRKTLCDHVQVVPEAASVVFGGGFPRRDNLEVRRAAQRAIFFVQRELEAAFMADHVAIALCDRATVDGLAYWPGPEDLWSAVGTTLPEQLARYHAVIHLRTPALSGGYNHQNPLRIESAVEASAIDARIAAAWSEHPRRFEVPSMPEFLAKVARVIEIVRAELPPCCRTHPVAELGERDGPGGDDPRTESAPQMARACRDRLRSTNQHVGQPPSGTVGALRPEMTTQHLNVSGMTCGSCVAKVSHAISAVPGVDHVDVSLAAQTADVRFDEARVSVDALNLAVRSAGYDVTAAPAKASKAGCCCR